MDSAKIRSVGVCLAAPLMASLLVALPASSAHAQSTARGRFMVRVQLEPGALLARQNGPLTLGLNSFGLAGSLTVGVNVSESTAVGVEGWVGLAMVPSLDITAPDFDGAASTVAVKGPSLMALLVGPSITHAFVAENFSVSATAGAALASFGYDSYDVAALPYNRRPDENMGMSTAIPLDKTNVGWGFGVALAKLWPLADAMYLGVGAQFRYLVVPDDAVYYDDDARGPLRYRADVWSITSFGLNVSLTYF